MPERDGYIPGVPCWIDCNQPDPDRVRPFYEGLFGWTFEDVMPEGAGGRYLIGRIRGGDVGAVGASAEGDPTPPTWNTYIWVDSADDTAAKAKAAGGTVVVEPFDVMDAGRMAVVLDPEGAAFSLWQPRNHKGSRIVNEHGSVNFNTLVTRDPESAAAFYGTLFGWKVLPLPAGQMWALPGYGDHLEELTPGLHEQMAQMGAPDGFIDVVASLERIADDDSDTPAHWAVTFAVDDVRASAAEARALGGAVLTEPVDVPWSRMATIEDPGGAVFIASQFVPENAGIGT